jgi:nitrate reductase gamma subunit
MSAWPLVWTGLGVLVVVGTVSLLLRRSRRGPATPTSSDDDPRGS